MLDSLPATAELFDLIDNGIDRAIFVLHYKWGLTYSEIGECFNLEDQTVKDILKSSKNKLISKIMD